MAQAHPRDSQGHCPFCPRAPGRPAARKAHAKPRTGRRRPAAADKDLPATRRWPRPSPQPGVPREAPYVAWTDHMERPRATGQARSRPAWTARDEARDRDSSVSSGRLSGSSGGHRPCTPAHRPWKERAPQVLGSPRQHGESNPRLERLREKIRAQVRWQASCASLGTSMPSSASHLLRASPPAPRRKVRKLKKAPPAPACPGFGNPSAARRAVQDHAAPGQERVPSRGSQRQASAPREKHRSMKSSSCKREKVPRSSHRRSAKDQDSELVGVYAWRKGQALVRGLLGPPPTLPRLQSKAPSGAPAPTAELGVAAGPVGPRTPRPAAVRSDPQLSAHTPTLAFCNQAGSIQSAMAVLRDLRQQIQAGLELAQDHCCQGGPERRQLAGRRPQGHWSAPDVRGSFRPAKVVHCSASECATSTAPGQRWGASVRRESSPQRTWFPQGQDPAFQGPGSRPERPWSASAGQRARAPRRAWEASPQGPWSPPAQRPWSASFLRRAGAPVQGTAPPWPRPAQSTSQQAPRQEKGARPPPPCPKARGSLGVRYSPASLREFMRQRSLARQQQALEEKAAALQARELRSQRLQDVYRQQREAVRGRAGPAPTKAFPLVSQKDPSIVTFVPHSAPPRGQDAPGGEGSPAQQWSKVTSGMVLGDQEAPGSFCLCLDRALDHEPLETGGPQEGWVGAPLPTSAGSPSGPLKLQDLAAQPPRPGLCIYLGSEEAERLGTRGPLHFRYKQARLQALETMANVLNQRIDLLTAKLLGADATDTLEGLPSNLPPSHLGTCRASLPPSLGIPKPVIPACPQTLVPDASRGSPWADMRASLLLSPACLPDGETLLWSPDWEQRRSVSPGARLASSPPGPVEDGCLELNRRLSRDTASIQALDPLAGRLMIVQGTLRQGHLHPGSTSVSESSRPAGSGPAPLALPTSSSGSAFSGSQSCSSLKVPAPPDPTCGSLWLDEMPSARGAGLVSPWTLQSCGQQEPGRHYSDLQQKSLGFLQTLKLDQQKQEQALALLRQRAELEVRETQKALDELLSKHRLARLEKRKTQARPGAAPEREELRLWAGLDPKPPWSAVTARSRSQPSLGRDAAAPSWGPEEGWESPAGPSACAAPLQEPEPGHALSHLPMARLYPWDHPVHQVQEEELLREEAVQAKANWERAWRACQRCPGSQGSKATLVLAEKQLQGLSSLEQGQRETRRPGSSHVLSCQERTLLLRHHQHILSVQRAVACLQQELLATAQLVQGSSPKAKAAWEWGSQQPVGPAQGSSCSPTARRPCSPSSHSPWRSPESPSVPSPVPEQDGTAPRETSASDVHLWPLRPAWGEETSMADGWVDAQEGPVESGRQMGQGDPQPNPSPSSRVETRAPRESHGQSSRGPGGSCSPREASQAAEGSTSRVGAELEQDFASSPGREAPEEEGQWSEEQRTETCWQEEPHDPNSWQEATQLTNCPAPAEEARPPTQHQGSPLPQLPAPSAPDSPPASVPGTCSGSPVGSRTPSSVSGLSCPSLQEFQKVSAILVQLSGSSASLSDWEAGDAPDADPGSSGEFSFGASRGWLGGGGQAACGACPPWGSPTAPGPGLLQADQPQPRPHVPSPGSGSELSEVSSEVWDEESPLKPGTGAQPAAGWPFPAGGSSDLEVGGAPSMALLSPGPGGGQEASGTGGSLTSESDAGKASWPCLSIPFPSGSPGSKGAGVSQRGGTGPLQVSTDCPEEPRESDLSPQADRNPPRAPPATPRVLAALRPESRAPGQASSGVPAAPGEASPALEGRVLPEILSPVDEVLSYGSADLPSSTHRAAPPPPALPAGSGATPSSPSEDFPSLPEDASTSTGEFPSLSEALSLGPQEASLCLAADAQGRSLGDQLGLSHPPGGNQAVGGQWPEPAGWLRSPWCGGVGNAPAGPPGQSVQPPTLSGEACGAGEGLPALRTAGHMGLAGPWQADSAPALDGGPCVGPGGDRAEVVDLVSTQLSRRILCDTLAVLSELVPPGSPGTGELAGAARVPGLMGQPLGSPGKTGLRKE